MKTKGHSITLALCFMILSLSCSTALTAPYMTSFPGYSGLISMGAPEGLNASQAITMEAWIFPTGRAPASDANGVIIGKGGEYLMARFGDGTIRWALANNSPGWTWVSTGVVVPESKWSHVAVVYDGSTIKTFVNGFLVHSANGSGTIGDVNTDLNDFWIGGRGSIDQRFTGYIDEARVWNTALASHEIRANRYRLLEGDEPGLAGYWRMDEGSGDTIADQTANQHDGTREPGVGWRPSTSPAGVPVVETTTADMIETAQAALHGEVREGDSTAEAYFEWGEGFPALAFDGLDDQVLIPHTDEMNGDPANGPFLTMAAWIKVPPGASGGIVNKYTPGALNGWQIYVFNGEVRSWYFRNNSSHLWGPNVWTDRRGLNGGRVDDNQWHHVAFQTDTGGGYLYVDGSLRAQLGWTGSPGRCTTTRPLSIGNYQLEGAPHGFLEGMIQDVGLWRTDLPVGAINDIMRGERYYESFLVGRWILDERAGQIASDAGGNGHVGIVHGNAAWVRSARPPNVYAHRSEANPVTLNQRALSFDGENDFVASQSDVDLANQSFSVEFWAKRDRTGVSSVAVAQTEGISQDPQYANQGLHIGWRSNNAFTFAFFYNDLNTPDRWSDPGWHHWACTFDASTGDRRIYRDGILIAHDNTIPAEGSQPELYTGTGPIRLGLREFIPADDWPYAGQLREVRIWSAALEQETILDWKDRPAASDHPNLPALKAYWKLTRPAGNIAGDSTAARNHGRLYPDSNGPVWVNSGPAEQTVSGLEPGTPYFYRAVAENDYGMNYGEPRRMTTHRHEAGTALRFDGHSALAKVFDFDSPDLTQEATIEFWQITDQIKNQSSFGVGPDSDGTERIHATVPWGDGKIYWDFGDRVSGAGRLEHTPDNPASLFTQWHHFALVSSKERDLMQIFIDGQLVEEKPSQDDRTSAGRDLFLAFYNDLYLGGAIDEFRVWSQARTPEQITRNYNAPLTGNEPGLYAYYKFDEGTLNGTSGALVDSSGNHRHGVTLNGARYIPSRAAVGLPVATTGETSDLAFGAPVLNGEVRTGGQPVTVWFEWGEGDTRNTAVERNEVAFWFLSPSLESLDDIDFDAEPDLVDSFYNINIPSSGDAFWPDVPNEAFAARFQSKIHIPTDGVYAFYTHSDDGSRIYIDGEWVVDNDGIHGMLERGRAVSLKSGLHDFEVRFFENTGGNGLIVSYAGPGIPKQVIPPEAFVTVPPVYSSTTSAQSLGSHLTPQPVNAQLPGLPVGTYHYRVVAENPNGLVYGENQTFNVVAPASGNAVSLDGVNDFIQIGSNPALQASSALTVEGWFYPAGPGNGSILFNREGEYEVGRTAEGELWWAVENGNRWRVILTGETAPLNTWTHVAFVYDAGTVRIYKNGVLIQTSTGTGNIGDRHAAEDDFRIGGRQLGNGYFDGYIDEVRVWKRALSAAEIQQGMNTWLTGSEPDLALYLRFNEGTGASSTDLSSNELTATLVNGADWVPSDVELDIPPIVETTGASPVLAVNATLNGLVNPAEFPTVAWFEWWPESNPLESERSDNINVGDGPFHQHVTQTIAGLDPGTAYHYRIQAGNSIGTSTGAARTFSTLLLDCGWPVTTKVTGGSAFQPVHTTDSSGHVIVAGLFSETATFGSTVLQTEDAAFNLFVGKLNLAGEWVWAKAVPVSNEIEPSKIVADPAGNIYLAGGFGGIAEFGDTQLISESLTESFAARLSPDGEWLWAKRVSGTGLNRARSATVDDDGNLYLAGDFSGNAIFGETTLDSTGNEDVYIAALSSSGQWQWAQSAGGPLTDRARALATSGNRLYLAGEFSQTAPFGSTLLTSVGNKDWFLTQLNTNGDWLWAKRGGGSQDDSGVDLAVTPNGGLFLLGSAHGVVDYDGATQNLGASNQDQLFVARLNSDAAMDWFVQGGASLPGSIATDAAGNAYVVASFQNSAILGNNNLFSKDGSVDLYVARINGATGDWDWAQQIGSAGAESPGGIAFSPDGAAVVSGAYEQTVALGQVSLTATTREIFLARLNRNGDFEYNAWNIGEAVPVPDAARAPEGGAFQLPEIVIHDPGNAQSTVWGDYFYWSQAENLLYPVRPVGLAEIRWPLSDALDAPIIACLGRNLWPQDPQIHVAGAPVELQPDIPDFPLTFQEISFTDTTGEVTNAGDSGTQNAQPVFNAAQPGMSVLRFLVTNGDPINLETQPARFEVVRTIDWNDPNHLTDSRPAVIGTAIENPDHQDPTAKNGYVVTDRAPVDMTGPAAAHQRDQRTGPILPVNQGSAGSMEDDLVVAWYHVSPHSGIAWPDTPVRYLPEWPSGVDHLVIASGLGSGALPTSEYPNKTVYHQPDPALAGYNPNEEHALLLGDNLFALRNDLNAVTGASEPFVLLKYRDPDSGQWTMKLWRVLAENSQYTFNYPGQAGLEIPPPEPLRSLGVCLKSEGVSGPYFEDYNGKLYARAAGPDDANTTIVAHYFYPLQNNFFYDMDGDGSPDAELGECVPMLDHLPGGTAGTPVDIAYDIQWPDDVPTLQIGETLFDAKNGLPAVKDFANAQVIYDDGNADNANPAESIVRLFDPLSERTLQLDETFELPPEIATANDRGRLVFTDLPFAIRTRLYYDSLNQRLSFGGYLDDSGAGEPLLLINVMSARERDRVNELSQDASFRETIDALYDLTRNPNRLDLDGDGLPDQALLIGLAGTEVDPRSGVQSGGPVHEPLGDLPKALTAGLGTGAGYVTLVENNDPDLAGLPVSLKILRVEGGPYQGELKVIFPDNVFDEKLTLRHSGDFGGAPENLEFEWYYHPDDGFDPTVLPMITEQSTELNGWTPYQTRPASGVGANDITIGDGGDSSLLTLADNWFIVRYRGYTVDGTTPWSEWAGAPGGDRGQLAEGWVKRVVDGLNPFEARTKDFHEAEAATYASMIQQAGRRYEGDIAFNPDADSINNVGLIEAYETVLRRGQRLSIDAVPPVNYGPANNALLLAASRIADLYMLLGNDAFADAADPTIGFPTTSQEYGSLASTIFAFQNQLDSLLEEELVLLRGRDPTGAPVAAPPVYNRLFWNFTNGEGEVAYAQTYNITDVSGPGGDPDGVIDETDAKTMFPQGHGDAWGHYLTAAKTYYELLRDPDFDWIPRTESVLLAGVPVEVDYLDERKFARAAAYKAKTGAEIVDLTYRSRYVDDPAGQWQGYQDADTDRAWGVTEWSRRAGQAAYFDWVTAHAVLPAVDPDPTHTGIRKIDRTTVSELDEIHAGYELVQGQVDKADAGLNPVGLAQGVVPFDIDPSRIDEGLTHFEQLYERAVMAMQNAVTVFNHANQLTQSLRRNQDEVNEFSRNVTMQERDYKNRLIELFGYPYAGDIGPGGTYPSGYDGPDLYHYMYVDAIDLNGETAPPSETFSGFFTAQVYGEETISHYFPDDLPDLQTGIEPSTLEVSYPFSTADFGFIPPESWGARRAPGEIQLALSTLLQNEAALRKALKNYDALIRNIEDQIDLLQARYDLNAESVRLSNIKKGVTSSLKIVIAGAKATQKYAEKSAFITRRLGDIAVEGVPKVVGTASDVTAPLRASLLLNAEILAKPAEIAKGVAAGVEAAATAAKEATIAITESKLEAAEERYEVQQQIKALEQSIRDEAAFRLEVYTLRETVNHAAGEYLALVARGLRLIEERVAFRKNAAAETQVSRYQDLSFRIFRNDAIQKYRAQFDLAQRYVFLAATAYDYETQLLGGPDGEGNPFLTDIIRERNLGRMDNGQPTTGEGLANTLAVLNQNFGVLKGRLGFNNPQTETGQFSLRKELFRISDNSDDVWRSELRRHRVDNLWDLPEFRRYCRIFVAESDGAQPGLVIRFPTTILSGLNLFGWPLSPGDSSYDTTLFSTKVRSVGVWFSNYEAAGLANAPRVYLVPVGQDVLRTPAGDSLATREWRIIDQKLPVPFPIGAADLNDPSWIPLQDSFGNLGDYFGDIRKFSSFRAYHDSGFSQDQVFSSNRLIGRSVWNTDWMLIIRGATFLNDPDEGLERFVNEVSDIKIFFQTYSFSGN